MVSQAQIKVNGNLVSPRHRAKIIENVSWQGRPALLLDGLAYFPEWALEEGVISVDIAAEGAAYCGVVFHGQDQANFELVYAQPHTSGRWDALQYDPVFRGSNTWQLYHGPGAQQATRVPQGEWFTLEVAFDARTARVRVDGGEPLVIPRLAHGIGKGFVGIWTYLPAYFSDLRIEPVNANVRSVLDRGAAVAVSPGLGTGVGDSAENVSEASRMRKPEPGGASKPMGELELVREWYLEGYGRVECEPNGILNLNRYLPIALTEVRLVRRFVAERQTQLDLSFGFSDVLKLEIDGQVLYEGEHLFAPDRQIQGYVGLDHRLEVPVSSGEHTLIVTLSRTELFGWGMIMSFEGEGIRAESAALG